MNYYSSSDISKNAKSEEGPYWGIYGMLNTAGTFDQSFSVSSLKHESWTQEKD